MGIKGLMGLIREKAPHSMREVEFKALSGQKLAIDASMCIE